jgi:hypothetical protein
MPAQRAEPFRYHRPTEYSRSVRRCPSTRTAHDAAPLLVRCAILTRRPVAAGAARRCSQPMAAGSDDRAATARPGARGTAARPRSGSRAAPIQARFGLCSGTPPAAPPVLTVSTAFSSGQVSSSPLSAHLVFANSRAARIASCDSFGCKHKRWKQQSAAARRRGHRTCAIAQSRASGCRGRAIAFLLRAPRFARSRWRHCGRRC